jgi:Rhomboid family
MSGNTKKRGPLDFGSPLRRCTDSLLVLNALMFVLQWASKDALMLWGAKVNSLIAAGQWWRLLTSSFLHTSAFHLLVSGCVQKCAVIV